MPKKHVYWPVWKLNPWSTVCQVFSVKTKQNSSHFAHLAEWDDPLRRWDPDFLPVLPPRQNSRWGPTWAQLQKIHQWPGSKAGSRLGAWKNALNTPLFVAYIIVMLRCWVVGRLEKKCRQLEVTPSETPWLLQRFTAFNPLNFGDVVQGLGCRLGCPAAGLMYYD